MIWGRASHIRDVSDRYSLLFLLPGIFPDGDICTSLIRWPSPNFDYFRLGVALHHPEATGGHSPENGLASGPRHRQRNDWSQRRHCRA